MRVPRPRCRSCACPWWTPSAAARAGCPDLSRDKRGVYSSAGLSRAGAALLARHDGDPAGAHARPVRPGGPTEQGRGQDLLDGPLQPAGAVGPADGLVEQQLARPVPDLQLVAGRRRDPGQVRQDGVEDPGHAGAGEVVHEDDGVEAVEDLGRQEAPDLGLGGAAAVLVVAEAGGRAGQGAGPGVGGEDDVEPGGVHGPPRVVGQRAVAEDLQQERVAQDGRGLVHLVEQEDGARAAADPGGQPVVAVLRADVAGRRAEQRGSEVVGGQGPHVHSDERLGALADTLGQGARQQRLTGPGASRQQQGGAGAVGDQAQPAGPQGDLGGDRAARLLLAQHPGGQRLEEGLDVEPDDGLPSGAPAPGGSAPGVLGRLRSLGGKDAPAPQQRPPARPQVQQALPEGRLGGVPLARDGRGGGANGRLGDGDPVVLLQALGRCAQVVHDLLRPGRGARVHNGSPWEEGAARAQVVELVPALAGDHDERRDAEVAGDRPGRVRNARLDGVGSVIHRHEDVPPVGGREGGALGAPSQVGQVVTAVQCARQGGVRRDVRQGGLQAVDEVGGRQVLRGDEQDVLRAAGAEAGERVEQPSAQRALVGRRRCGRGAVLREDERLCFHTAYDGHGRASIRSSQQSTRYGVAP